MPRAKIIAEVSGNHAGKLEHAHALIDAAKTAGADYVKFQAFTLDEMTPNVVHPAYVLPDGPWAGRTLRELYLRTRTPLEWLPQLFQHARDVGLDPFASVFGIESFEAVRQLDPTFYKIASAEALDIGLVRLVRSAGRGVMVSLGMRDWAQPGLIAMWCVAEYPTTSAHLPKWHALGSEWGFSDHTLGNLGAQLAVALGAQYLEKHLMLDGVSCEDETFSLTPAQFALYVTAIREAESHLTQRTEMPTGFARRWVANRSLRPGPLAAGDLRTARANVGILATYPLKRLRVSKSYGEPILIGEAE